MNKQITSLGAADAQIVTRKGEEIYNRIRNRLEKKYFGKFAAIEVGSEKYFVGDDQIRALKLAKKEFPGKIFYFVRIGSSTVFTHSTYKQPLSHGSIF